jgi:hydroxyacylglutathione hydrolase
MAKLEIVQLPPARDNYAVLLHDPASRATAAIDAPEADVIMGALQHRGWRLGHIFVTHKHLDHIEGSGPEGGLFLRRDRPRGERGGNRHV